MKIPKLDFSSGEVSPLMWWRPDLPKYGGACRELTNFIPLPQGGIKRRIGSEVVARIGTSATYSDSAIILWNVDRENYFHMVLAGTSAYFYNSDGALVFTLSGLPWASSEYKEISHHQVFDELYLAHANHPLQVIRRTDTFTWTIDDATIEGLTAENNLDQSKTVTYNHSAKTLSASSPIFLAGDVGRTFKLANNSLAGDSGVDTTNFTSSALTVRGIATMTLAASTWTGKINMEFSLDGGSSWEVIGSYESDITGSAIIISRDVQDFGAKIRLKGTVSAGSVGWLLSIDGIQYDYFTIDVFNSTTSVDVTPVITNGVNISNGFRYAMGVFGGAVGFPSTVTVFEERLILAGADGKPCTIWGSAINNWEDFVLGTSDIGAISFSPSTDFRHRIRWMISEKTLIFGTDSGEWTIGGFQGVLTATNVDVKRHSQYGGEPVQPVSIADMVFYIEAGGKKMRGMRYSRDAGGYIADDFNFFAPHIFQGTKAARIAYSRTPDQAAWVVSEEGQLFTLTYQPEAGITAWAQQDVSGKVLDMSVVFTLDGDEVSILVERTDGVYLEKIAQADTCLDGMREINGITSGELIGLDGDEAYRIYNNELINLAASKGTGQVFLMISAYTDITADNDVVALDDDFFWAPSGTANVYDAGATLTAGVDYNIFDFNDIFLANIHDPSINLSALSITYNAVPLVLNTAYFVVESSRQVIILGDASNNILLYDLGLTVDQYTLTKPRQFINTSSSNIISGIEMTSTVETVEIFSSVDASSGNRGKVHEIDLFVIDSVGGEVSTDGGERFESILCTPKNVIAGERIIPETGKKEIRLQQGYNDDLTVIIKNQTPYRQTISALGLKAKTVSS